MVHPQRELREGLDYNWYVMARGGVWEPLLKAAWVEAWSSDICMHDAYPDIRMQGPMNSKPLYTDIIIYIYIRRTCESGTLYMICIFSTLSSPFQPKAPRL